MSKQIFLSKTNQFHWTQFSKMKINKIIVCKQTVIICSKRLCKNAYKEIFQTSANLAHKKDEVITMKQTLLPNDMFIKHWCTQ